MKPVSTPLGLTYTHGLMPRLALGLIGLTLCFALGLTGCSSLEGGADKLAPRTASIQRTAYGVPHITAPDLESLAYGVAYAHAQDNFCQTAEHLITVRGQRSVVFGPGGQAQLGVRTLPNEQIDAFMATHMDDAKLNKLWAQSSADNQALARGYVAGYNRYLQDNKASLPKACKNETWLSPMTLSDYYRAYEVVQVQAGAGALADGIVAARPPQIKAAQASPSAPMSPISPLSPSFDIKQAQAALYEAGLYNSPLGSNAWAFGKQVTANGRGMLLGNPHFPWVGTSRFYQMHVTVPGQFDVMGASIGLAALVQIGFNKDVAWSHTVSTGKRFTLHELTLVAGDPTSYMVDGQAEKMQSKTSSYSVRQADGKLVTKQQTLWISRFGPIVVVPRAGLNWTDKAAYALQDANTGNLRGTENYIGFAKARNVNELKTAMAGLGTSWVNTIAADRDGNALYADMSVVPNVDSNKLQQCAPSRGAAALLGAVGLVVLNGSRSECNWQVDASSPVAGLTPPERMPSVVRSDWVHNSNDSFFYTHPAVTWPSSISPLVGDDVVRRARTRSGLIEVPELIGRGKVSLSGIQQQLFENRNIMARMVLPDLLGACAAAPNAQAKDGCAALKLFSDSGYRNDTAVKGAHLFREFWRSASNIPGVYKEPFDKARPVETPRGLRLNDAATAAKIWGALSDAVDKVRAAGFALDAPLGSVQVPAITPEKIALHGGDEIEGVLNNLGDRVRPGIGKNGIQIDYGSSYVQTVSFDERGPVAQGLLTYGQSTNPDSPHVADQLRLYASKQWPTLPFHAEDVAKQRVGEVLILQRP
jgi:acyl-homoserine-lactone acylase